MTKKSKQEFLSNPEEIFKGKYDKNNVVLSIYSGAGGIDAQDWAEMLLRMYLKYAQKKEWRAEVLQIKPGKEAGIKQAVVLIETPYAYGYLKQEAGVHRLVRLSPFNSDHLRHTSFALVDILPEIKQAKEIEIRPQDLKIETYRASGPGGQYVNKTDSAVRITHLPSGLTVACQSERLQGENKRKAMKVLTSRLYQMKQASREEEIRRIRGELMPAEWGSQIRSYVLHPYKLVKDHRSGIKSSDPEAVLDGKLDKFIINSIKK